MAKLLTKMFLKSEVLKDGRLRCIVPPCRAGKHCCFFCFISFFFLKVSLKLGEPDLFIVFLKYDVLNDLIPDSLFTFV